MSASQLEDRQCPYCRCTFTPASSDQRYCSVWCEEADRERQK